MILSKSDLTQEQIMEIPYGEAIKLFFDLLEDLQMTQTKLFGDYSEEAMKKKLDCGRAIKSFHEFARVYMFRLLQNTKDEELLIAMKWDFQRLVSWYSPAFANELLVEEDYCEICGHTALAVLNDQTMCCDKKFTRILM